MRTSTGVFIAALAQRAQNLEAVAAGQRQVQQDDVECLGVHPEERPFAGALDHHVVAFVLEPFAQGIGHLLFVLDDQQQFYWPLRATVIEIVVQNRTLWIARPRHPGHRSRSSRPCASNTGQVRRLERHLVRMAMRPAISPTDGANPRSARRSRTWLASIRRDAGGVRLLLSADGRPTIECTLSRDTTVPWRVTSHAIRSIARDPFILHKTTRRLVYEDARRASPDLDDVLLWNERGEVTESTIGNVVAEIDGIRYTPPIASGLLGGTFRAEQLEAGTIQERVLTKADIAISVTTVVDQQREGMGGGDPCIGVGGRRLRLIPNYNSNLQS